MKYQHTWRYLLNYSTIIRFKQVTSVNSYLSLTSFQSYTSSIGNFPYLNDAAPIFQSYNSSIQEQCRDPIIVTPITVIYLGFCRKREELSVPGDV
ncbi:hypothetical protein BH18THE2_BH18THE2_13730 [soil metagenome]